MFYIIPSPIGNLDDITIRAIDVIEKVDFLVVENRATTKNLLKKFKIENKKIFTYNDHSNKAERQNILEQLKGGLTGGIISDAGTPLVCDPGYKLISELIINNVKVIPFKTERNWVAEHEHDDEVGSIAIERFGDVDPEKLNTWMGRLLSEKGIDIFRTKGFISYSGNPRRIVFQGVHMLFTAQPDKEWGNEPRRNQLVFIGRNLDEKKMQEGFDKCLI